MGAGLQGIQVRTHPVTEIDRRLDDRRQAAVHPGLGNGIVRIRGVDREPRLEDPVLHPAHKELRFRRDAVEAAYIAALVGDAGQAHSEDRRDIVFERIPAGQVIARPDLRIALDPGVSGAADRERTHIRIVLLNGFIGQLTHHVCHNGLQVSDRAALSFKEDSGILVHHGVIFAVIVPDRPAAVLKKAFADVLFPVLSGLLFCEVDKNTGTSPPCAGAESLIISD